MLCAWKDHVYIMHSLSAFSSFPQNLIFQSLKSNFLEPYLFQILAFQLFN
jgi:hypothetical protein